MKVAIITQPLRYNYGGLLQNYALQQVLIKMGHTPITFDQDIWNPPFSVKIKIIIRSLFAKSNPFKLFVKRNIRATSKARKIADFIRLERKYKPDAYIVGSDQVWRPKYNYLLDGCFLTFTDHPKKVAYAASFGTDEWEYSKEETCRYANYLKDFKYVSVREQSAIVLCKQHFGVDAQHVLDPTLLLKAQDYLEICMPETGKHEKYLFTYILDTSIVKQEVVKAYCEKNGCEEVCGGRNRNGEKERKLGVEEWLTYLSHASFVMCDSFHGTVFSILMHRPFAVLTNDERGNARLMSLLEILGLSNRLIVNFSDLEKVLNQEIKWETVDSKINSFRKSSLQWLSIALA